MIKNILKSMLCSSIAIGFIVLIAIITGMSIVFNQIEFIKSDPFAGIMTTGLMSIPVIISCKIMNKKKNK